MGYISALTYYLLLLLLINRQTTRCSQHTNYALILAAWRSGYSGVRRMNEVNARRARLVRGWMTVFGRVYHLGM